jgi:hypothetical protein
MGHKWSGAIKESDIFATEGRLIGLAPKRVKAYRFRVFIVRNANTMMMVQRPSTFIEAV